MESTHYLRLLRRRWILLLVFGALGAALGYASTLLGDDTEQGPLVSYWTASEVLVIPPSETVDLERLAVFATAGDVAQTVAADLGIELQEFTPFIRTITDAGEGTLEISVVTTGAESARDQAARLAQALQDELAADQLTDYDATLDAAVTETQRRLDLVTELDGSILLVSNSVADQERRVADGEEVDGEPVVVDPALVDRLAKLNIERDASFARYLSQSGNLEDLQREGPPSPILGPLESIPPFQISDFEFFGREVLGRQGQTNFTVGEVDLADTTPRLSVTERLEQPQARAVAGGIAGVLVGIMLVMLHLRLDPRLRTREAAEAAFDLPVLAEIPLMSRRERRKRVLHAVERPRSMITEAHRYLRSLLVYARATNAVTPELNGQATVNGNAAGSVPGGQAKPAEVRVVMVTSPGAGEGKTTTAANLAAILAEAGYRTVLVNCDHRLPKAHQMLGLDYTPATTVSGGVDNLWFVADVARVQGESPAEISRKQRNLLIKARSRFDVVVVDTAPLLATNDAIDLLSVTDLVVIVSREAKTTAAAAGEARELLDRMGTPIAGVVITCAGAGIGRRYYDKYRYGAYYGSASTAAAQTPTPQPASPQPSAPQHNPVAANGAAPAPVVSAQPPVAAAPQPRPRPPRSVRAEVDQMFGLVDDTNPAPQTPNGHRVPNNGSPRHAEVDLRRADRGMPPLEVDIRE